MSLRRLAQETGRAFETVRRWAHAGRLPQPRAQPKREAQLLRRTKACRAIVDDLARRTTTVKHRTAKTYNGTRAIAAVLARNHGITVNPSTVYRDLVALGFKRRTRCKDMSFTVEEPGTEAVGPRTGPLRQVQPHAHGREDLHVR